MNAYVWDIILAVAPYVIGFIIALIGFIIFRYSNQRKLINFLGANNNLLQVNVNLSSLLIPRGGSVGFDGKPRSYQGVTIPTEELGISTQLAKAFMSDAFEYIPPIIRKPLQDKLSFFRPLAINFIASPLQTKDIDFTTRSIITVGSQGYNIVTDYCVRSNLGQLQIAEDGTAIKIIKGKNSREVIRPTNNKHDIAILERVVDHTRNDTTIIIAAGLGVLGTMGAIKYLIDHWKDIDKIYNNGDFALVLQFGPTDHLSFEECLNGIVIRRIPEKL